MDADLGVMTVRRQSRREARALTRLSHSLREDFRSNHEPLVRVRMEARSFPALPTPGIPTKKIRCQ